MSQDSIPIYDSNGNHIGYKTKSFPSGEWVYIYPQRLKDNIERERGFKRK